MCRSASARTSLPPWTAQATMGSPPSVTVQAFPAAIYRLCRHLGAGANRAGGGRLRLDDDGRGPAEVAVLALGVVQDVAVEQPCPRVVQFDQHGYALAGGHENRVPRGRGGVGI